MSTNLPTIAVIDDDPGILKATGRLLSTLGFEAELYPSPGKFREVVATTQSSCLLVDIQLGGRCGVEFVRELRTIGISFPVIFMTGNDDEQIKKRALETGCIAFLLKPFPASLLIDALAVVQYARTPPRKTCGATS